MYFLRRAHGLYQFKPSSTLSPSFWESEGKNADARSGFDAIMPGIEHPLGLYYFIYFDSCHKIHLDGAQAVYYTPLETWEGLCDFSLVCFKARTTHLL